MALTPSEIVHKEFATKFRGYDPDQVNEFLDTVVVEFEKLINENNRLQNELDVAVEKNEYFGQLQESLNSSIMVAQEAADRLKQNARKEAELIILEAERAANHHVKEANEFVQGVLDESEDVKQKAKNYREEFLNLLRQQESLFTEDRFEMLFMDKKIMEDIEIPEVRTPHSVSKQVSELLQTTELELSPGNHEHSTENITFGTESDNKLFDDTVQEEATSFDDQVIEPSGEELYNNEEPTDNEQSSANKISDSFLGETIRIDLPKD